MIGVSIKAGITCPDCSRNIPLNALVPEIKCQACGSMQSLSIEVWKTVLDDAIMEAPGFEEGEGSSTTVLGTYNYGLAYGKLWPRYDGTSESIEQSAILENINNSFVLYPGTGEKTSVRPLPDEYGEVFQGVVALVGEDASLIPERGTGREVQTRNSRCPVAFHCPQCGGSLVVSGDNRCEKCSYCGTIVYLPDDLWRTLHPVIKKKTWFLLYDFLKAPFSWQRDLLGAVYTGDNQICIVAGNEVGITESDSGFPLVACVKKNRTPHWVRNDLNISRDSDGSFRNLTCTGDGQFSVPAGYKRDLVTFSSADGSLQKVRKPDESEVESENDFGFTMEECCGMVCFPNGEFIQLRRVPIENGHCGMLLRFDADCNRLLLWPAGMEEEKGAGFLSRLRKRFNPELRKTAPKSLEETGDRPEYLKDLEAYLSAGPDGSLYIRSNRNLAAFDSSGMKRYMIELPCNSAYGGASANTNGEAFVLVADSGGVKTVLKVSSDGLTSTVYCDAETTGGDFQNLKTLVLEPDGTLHMFGYGGNWITCEPCASVPADDTDSAGTQFQAVKSANDHAVPAAQAE